MGLVEAICRDVGVDVDVSAGSNAADQIEGCIDAGATRVVLGARALTEEDWLQSVAEAFPGALIVETTVRERRVVTRGWVRILPIDLLDIADDLAGIPVAGLLVTPAAGSEPELALLEDLVEACAFPVLIEDSHPTLSAFRAFEHRGLGAVVIPGAELATALDPRSVGNEFGR
jgi:phosphoribosylformimino-5-aminoimidazole carboxamide ribotide isomerase